MHKKIQEGWSFKSWDKNSDKLTNFDLIESVLKQLTELLKTEYTDDDIFVRGSLPTFRDSKHLKFVNAGIVTEKTSIFINANPGDGSLEVKIYSENLDMKIYPQISSILEQAFK